MSKKLDPREKLTPQEVLCFEALEDWLPKFKGDIASLPDPSSIKTRGECMSVIEKIRSLLAEIEEQIFKLELCYDASHQRSNNSLATKWLDTIYLLQEHKRDLGEIAETLDEVYDLLPSSK